MTYSKPMGAMYAAAGLGLGPSGIAPPFRRYGFRSFDGLGAEPGEAVSKRAADLQALLMQKGFSVGHTGADNVFGAQSQQALNRAMGRDVAPEVSVSSDRHTVRMPVAFWTRLAGMRDGQGGESIPLPSTATPTPPAPVTPMPEGESTEVVPDETLMQTLPWVAGAVALVGIGGYFIYKGRRRRVAANRRRRRRSSRRRR